MTRLSIGFLAFAINPYFEITESKRVEQASIQMLRDLVEGELMELPSLVFEEMALGHKTFEDMEMTVTAAIAEAVRQIQERPPDVLILQSGTFNLDKNLLLIAKHYQGPLVLWAYPEGVSQAGGLQINSLAGAMSNNSALRKIGCQPEFLYGLPSEDRVVRMLQRKCRTLAALKQMKQSTLGLIGVPFTGYCAATYDEMLIRRILGLEFIHFETGDFLQEVEKIDPAALEEAAASLGQCPHATCSVDCQASPRDIRQSARSYLALKQMMDQHRLDCVSIKCQPELKNQLDLNPCYSISRLGDEGRIVGCEGDVGLAVTMYLEYLLTGQSGVLMEIVKIMEETDTAVLWHCGQAPVKYADPDGPLTLERHTLVPGTTVVEFPFRPGRITLARFAHLDGTLKLFIAGGDVVKARHYFKGAYAEVIFDAGARTTLDCIFEQGVEHHQALVYGDIVQELREASRLLGIETIEPRPDNQLRV